MPNTDRTEDFTRDVDRILQEAGRSEVARPDPKYREDLVLAMELAATDFSSDSVRRAPLRRQLLSERAATRAEPAPWLWPWRQHPRLAAAAVAAAVVLAVLVIQPDLRASVIQPAIEYLKRLVLGERTEAVVVEPFSQSEMESILAERRRALEAGEQWSMRTAISQVGGDVPAGGSPVIRTYGSLGLAESAAAFPLAKPGHLPEGYEFDSAVITPDDGVVLWYRAPGERITLYQKPLGDSRMMAMSMGSGSSLEKVAVDGKPAAWLNDHKLVWESDGMSYTLEGNRLTLEEARRIAHSLR
jgi:hypothetical protein